jgi:hypothetical protein
MHAGANTLTVTVVGKDPHAAGYLVGIDGFTLK